MKAILFLILTLFILQLTAQPDTEVYLVDITTVDGKIKLINLNNISNNEGYDNQPSFYDDNTILFASTRNGQTDIAKYDCNTRLLSWITDTAVGSEYSPLRIPNSDAISSVRLDTTGYQRLYRYDVSTGKSEELLKDLKVGYHVWHNDSLLYTSVLVKNRMDLVSNNLSNGTSKTIRENVGRSLHQIPELSEYVKEDFQISFIQNVDTREMISVYKPEQQYSSEIGIMPVKSKDMCWLPDGSIIYPKGNQLLHFNPKTKDTEIITHKFDQKEIYQISRIMVSPNGKHLTLVAEAAPEVIVQKQVESFNAENLDDFAACYSENVVVRNFPNDTISTGNKSLKAGYKRYFESNPKTTVEVVKRIQMGNVVIDEELVERSGKTKRQAAIYEINGGKIASMTFIHEKQGSSKAEAVIEKNLKAYRDRDIDAFLSDYTENVEVFMFPNTLSYTGKEKMRLQYADFLKGAEGLTCEIKNRIVIGNMVIDEEFLTINGNHHIAVAIYEIEGDKISKVTFIQ